MGKQKVALVTGGAGFIGGHLIKRLNADGYFVIGADLKNPEFDRSVADEHWIGDLTDLPQYERLFTAGRKVGAIDEVYQLACNMGGAGYVFTGENDSEIMHDSAMINLHTVHLCKKYNVKKVFYSSSACMYPAYNQEDPNNPQCAENSAYPAAPDSEYGWEKLFSERLYLAYARNHELNVRIARFHNIFGPLGTYKGGKEKAPAAIMRKVLQGTDSIEIWGDGEQTRSFLYIDACIEGIIRLMASDCIVPVNIGSDEMITINELAQMAMDIAGKQLNVNHIESNALGVRGRNSDNTLIWEKLGWVPRYTLFQGLVKLHDWLKTMPL